MPTSLLLEGGESTYNSVASVVQGSTALTTASEQYWVQRRMRLESHATSFQAGLSASEAERSWQDFCETGTTFLNKILWGAMDHLEAPLAKYWGKNKRLAREGVRVFREQASIELLIPFSRRPVRFVRVDPKSTQYSVRVAGIDPNEDFKLGSPYILVSWNETALFVVTPIFDYVTMSTYCLDLADGTRLSSDLVLPDVFAGVSKAFGSDLEIVRGRFEPLMRAWLDKEQAEEQRKHLKRFVDSADKWQQVYLPEFQKVELLKGLELLEAQEPSAPRGLLLSGPSGVGKSLLGKTIAETAGCNFQHLTPATLKLDHLGGSGQKVREIWERARQEQPSILYLDECEGVLGRRGAAETDAISAEIVQAFLSEWDGLNKSDRVLVIGATNRRDLLDDAILSRFGWEMQISLPSGADRIHILEQELKRVDVDTSLPLEFASLTQGMSGRDLQEVARAARRMTHPEPPSLEQIGQAISRLRKSHNTKVSPQSKWENLILEDKLLSRLRLISSLLRDAEKWSAEGISIPRSLLLQGPSGTGKTEIARTLANESGLAFFAASTADIKANYLGQSGNRVRQIFERARTHAPCILFLDELDIVAPERSRGEDDPLTREIVGQLLPEIDGVEAHAEHIFLLAATNRPAAIDRAVLSRFAERLSVPLPDHTARMSLLKVLLTGKKLDFSTEDGARLLADLTEGKAVSGRDLGSWVASAEQNALARAFENGGPENYVITLDDFSSAS